MGIRFLGPRSSDPNVGPRPSYFFDADGCKRYLK